MNLLRKLGRSGSITAEFSLTVPILLALMFGIIQVGVLFFANAGLKHGLGEAARHATLWPRRTDAQIAAKVASAAFGINTAYLATPVITHGVSQGTDYTQIDVSYRVPLNIFFISLPTVTLTDSRRVFVP